MKAYTCFTVNNKLHGKQSSENTLLAREATHFSHFIIFLYTTFWLKTSAKTSHIVFFFNLINKIETNKKI